MNPTQPIITTTPTVVSSPVVSSDQPQPQVTSPVVETPSVATTEPVIESAPIAPTIVEEIDPIQKRINEITAQKFAEARRARDAEDAQRIAEAESAAIKQRLADVLAQQAQPQVPVTTTAPVKPAMTDDDINKIANERAREIARINEFNRACNNIVDKGKLEFKDFDASLDGLNLVGAIGKNANPEFLETAVELKDPHRVLHHLGKNLDEAERIIKMAPRAMALELARVEAALNVPAPIVTTPVSQAPAPVIPVTGAAKAGSVSIDDPNVSMDDWMQARTQQQHERQNRYQKVK